MATASGSAPPLVEAAIDIGSNTVHLLVGMVTDHAVTPLADESALLSLGDVVDAEGRLPFAARRQLLDALEAQAGVARRWQARDLVVLGTEPLRRAEDREEVAAAVLGHLGCRLDVLSHAEEVELTLLGVTRGLEVPDRLLVVDIGGGSSEWVLVRPGAAPVTGVLPTGSRRLTAACAPHDPLRDEDVAVLLAEARRLATSAIVAPPVERATLTGGSATNLLKVLPGQDGVLPPTLDRAGATRALESFVGESTRQLAERGHVTPPRARVLPAGAARVVALLEAFGLQEAAVSEASLREGAVIALARAGGAWRTRLSRLTHGWPGTLPAPEPATEGVAEAATRAPSVAVGPGPTTGPPRGR
ncbi:MAG: Ppx/GppA phosphatase family protein [Candidatus Limnocylindrales bacterium]